MLTPQQQEKVDQARERFGKKFAYEPGSEWKPQSEFFLTRWMRTRHKETTSGHQ